MDMYISTEFGFKETVEAVEAFRIASTRNSLVTQRPILVLVLALVRANREMSVTRNLMSSYHLFVRVALFSTGS